MVTNEEQKSPNDTLAEQIAQDLLAAGLIPQERKIELERKLKVGGVTQSDWNLWVDIATAPEKKGDKANE
jgi:hypothetical protein